MAKSIVLEEVNSGNIGHVKMINIALLPVRYRDDFYEKVLKNPKYFSSLAYYDGIAAGAICCRLEDISGFTKSRVYIMTLGVLAPYRKLGIGTKLLNFAFDLARNTSTPQVVLHVQQGNDAIDFYRNAGFRIDHIQEYYYTQVKPSSAIELVKTIELNATLKSPEK